MNRKKFEELISEQGELELKEGHLERVREKLVSGPDLKGGIICYFHWYGSVRCLKCCEMDDDGVPKSCWIEWCDRP